MNDLRALARQHNVLNRPEKTGHMVTVAQLRAALASLPDEAYVVLQKDSEGNGYSPLAVDGEDRTPAAYPVWYVPDSTWAGEVYNLEPDPDEADEDRFEPRPGDLFAVVLTPVN